MSSLKYKVIYLEITLDGISKYILLTIFFFNKLIVVDLFWVISSQEKIIIRLINQSSKDLYSKLMELHGKELLKSFWIEHLITMWRKGNNLEASSYFVQLYNNLKISITSWLIIVSTTGIAK